MDEATLRRYWSIYTDAWKLLKNYQKVTTENIAQLIEGQSDMVFACTVFELIWSEIEQLQLANKRVNMSDYQNMLTDTWRIFKEHSEPNETEEYWDNLIAALISSRQNYAETGFIMKMYYHVTLGELERLYELKRANP